MSMEQLFSVFGFIGDWGNSYHHINYSCFFFQISGDCPLYEDAHEQMNVPFTICPTHQHTSMLYLFVIVLYVTWSQQIKQYKH